MATATAAAPTLVSPPTGGFPRELRLTADGHTLLVTNFFSRTVEARGLESCTPSPGHRHCDPGADRGALVSAPRWDSFDGR